MAHFATENLGSALRDQAIAPDLQQRIRQLARFRGVNPDLADHVANQAVGANAVKDLLSVIRGRGIEQGKAQTLQDMGILQQSDPTDPTSPLHLTEDAQRLLPPGVQRFVQLKPDRARYTPSPDPAHGSALYQNAVAGMERFSNTAERMLLPPPSVQEASAAPTAIEAGAQPPGTQVDSKPQGWDSAVPPVEKPGSPVLQGDSHGIINKPESIISNALDEDSVHFHHPYPMYLGGHEKQILEPLPKSLHDAYHRGLDAFLPRRKSKAFYDNLSPVARGLMLRKLGEYTKSFDAKNGTNLFDAMAREAFPNAL
jgi:hypothetical protein